MSLRKSPTRTPASLEAHRRNARHSTGLRTARGQSWSAMNRLGRGTRSRAYRELLPALCLAPPGQAARIARALLTPAPAARPALARLVEIFVRSETGVASDARGLRAKENTQKKMLIFDVRSWNVL